MTSELNSPKTIEAITAMAKKASGFDLEEVDGNRIFFSTRDHGSVADERPGIEDIRAARKAAKEIEAKYPQTHCKIEDVDEWVHLEVKVFDRILPPRPPGQKSLQKVLEEAISQKIEGWVAKGLAPNPSCIYTPSTGQGINIMPFGGKVWNQTIQLQLFTSGQRTDPNGYAYELKVYASGQGSKSLALPGEPTTELVMAALEKANLLALKASMEKKRDSAEPSR